jgi:diguanylate cyclase (GGDEF)-like protein
MRLPVGGFIRKNKRTAICLSLFVLAIDLLFLTVNCVYLKKSLHATLLQQAVIHQEEFRLNLKMAYSSMLQMSSFISSRELSRRLLEEAKQGAEGTKDEKEQPVSPYQFGFVESPQPLLSSEKPVYSWLRGVSPVWAVDPATGKRVYVGTLEVSTSFKEIVPLYSKLFRVDAAVLLNKDYVTGRMQDRYIKEYFEKNPNANHYLEITTTATQAEVAAILSQVFVRKRYITDRVTLIPNLADWYRLIPTAFSGTSHYRSVYYFPLTDYQPVGSAERNSQPVGFVLIWEDVSEHVQRFFNHVAVSTVLALIGFILIESGLLWIFSREARLTMAEQYASVDELTGLYNRRYLDDLLENELSRAERNQGVPLSLIICDVDYFKKFNDTYGHKAGDECLKKIADALRRQAKRSSDCVARYGGEEFVIILPRTDLNSAIEIAENTRKAVLSLKISHSSSDTIPLVTVTLGAACTSNLASYDSLFEAADRNLYLGKNKGRNRVEPPAKSASS